MGETDLISRKAAIDAAERESQVDGAYGYMDTKSIVDMLNDLPSAQPEQKKGKWIPHEDEDGEHYGDKCSECGEWYVMPYGKTNFCPNCGARMEEEHDE